MLICVPAGYLVAMMLNELGYDLEHTYFTKVSLTMQRITYVHLAHLLFTFGSFVICMQNENPQKKHEEHEFWETVVDLIKLKETWHNMLPLTFVFFILVYSIPHFDYLVNTFPFVFEVARLFQMYFMIGAAWACTSYKIVSKCTKNRRILMWIAMCVYFVSQACMLGLIEQFVDVYITSACSFASGLSLMYGIITSLTILIESTQKEGSV